MTGQHPIKKPEGGAAARYSPLKTGATAGRRGAGLDELSGHRRTAQQERSRRHSAIVGGSGENKQVSPAQMGAVLDPGAVDQLAEATGIDRDELLAGLARTLPGVVDRLTPDGRLPTPQEWQRLL